MIARKKETHRGLVLKSLKILSQQLHLPISQRLFSPYIPYILFLFFLFTEFKKTSIPLERALDSIGQMPKRER